MQAVDVLIVGSGLAGLRLALALPETVSVVIVTKRLVQDTNTQWAQGGIAAAWEEDHGCEELHQRAEGSSAQVAVPTE